MNNAYMSKLPKEKGGGGELESLSFILFDHDLQYIC